MKIELRDRKPPDEKVKALLRGRIAVLETEVRDQNRRNDELMTLLRWACRCLRGKGSLQDRKYSLQELGTVLPKLAKRIEARAQDRRSYGPSLADTGPDYS